MKRLLLLLTIFVNNIFSQTQDSRNGLYLPTKKGIFPVFIVFAEVTGDPGDTIPRAGWNVGDMPTNPGSYIDADTINYQSHVSRYYNEISFGELKVIGDYYDQLIQIPYSSFTSAFQSYDRVFEKLSELCNGQQIQTAPLAQGS